MEITMKTLLNTVGLLMTSTSKTRLEQEEDIQIQEARIKEMTASKCP